MRANLWFIFPLILAPAVTSLGDSQELTAQRSFRVEVTLPNDRKQQGTLKLIDPVSNSVLFGPVPVLGRAASSPSNPTLDPLRTNGHTPLGSYKVTAVVRTGEAGPASPGAGAPVIRYPTTSFGPYAVIAIDPVGGDALRAKQNGRTGLLIHAGGTESNGRLSPTRGCLRLATLNQKGLIDMLLALSNGSAIGVEVVVSGAGPAGMMSLDTPTSDGDPPPSPSGMRSLVPIAN
jgi:hypothetical protein